MNKLTSFIIKLFGIEEQSEWLRTDKTNVFITAVFPTITTIICTIIQSGEINWHNCCHIISNPVFANSMHLLVIACTLLVIYRNQRSIRVTKEKVPRLSIFIKNKCNLRDQSEDCINATLKVTKKTVSQFNMAWIILWLFLFIYYCGNLSFSILEQIYKNDLSGSVVSSEKVDHLKFFFNTLFDFLSSTAMFSMFVILNSVTVSFDERKHGRHGLVTAVFFMVTFGCCILLPSYFSFVLEGWSYVKLRIIVSLLLGMYSALSFVLALGKLNNNLQIPRILFYGLYLYALVLANQFLLVLKTDAVVIRHFFYIPLSVDESSYTALVFLKTYVCHNEIFDDIQSFLKCYNVLFHIITFFGKIFLSLIMLWIVYDSKFIYFVLQQSQIITDLPYKMDVFKTYMKDDFE